MGSLTDFAENELLDHLFNAAYSPAATIYLVLCTADPTDAATGASCNEVANANGYARTAISFGTASARRITQDALVTFPAATGSWGTVTYWCLADSATHGPGNILAHGAFSASFSPVSGNTPKVASGQVYVEFSATSGGAGLTTYACNALLGLMFDNVAFTSTAGNTFLALLTATSSDAATTMAGQTEASGTSYARLEINPYGGSAPAWTLASGGTLSNGADATFATPGSGGWGTVVAMAIVDAASGTSANVLAYDNNNITDQAVSESDTVLFASGALDVTMS